MSEQNLCEIIRDEANRALWEVHNTIECVPDQLWNKFYCEMPMWKHIYHMLHSLDLTPESILSLPSIKKG